MGLFPYFLSDCLFLVRRNIPDFCILILYTVAFLNSFMLTELWCFLEFSMYNVSLTNRANFISSYLMTWMPFVSFSCLLALARTSWLHWIDMARVGVLTSSWSSRECLLWAHPIRPLSCWAMFLPYPINWEFVSWRDVLFCHMLFLHLLRQPCVLFLILLMWWITFFMGIEPSLCPWNKSYLIMVYDHFNVLLNLVC